ncbi:TPA: hypothetical protein KD853_002814 [Vibrio parahaemolyticus]|uniref:Uncharacterized protein n=2 Tax=Vibrio parahaemolyticus TaxID=670 RepID=A0A9P2VFU9_VIBPH|nr:hypothetical protein [Vibrio parahaemolyticus]EGQ7681320.1 hypothetical protein [Vibrio parahaemolyticus]EGQ7799971.1 hypothetical protein [Vibrio parahaemolyticus]EGQ8112846.1 hypothetical protein [Vibrio parahaemolyticus]EGQ8132071.1 hypothetical protein [Vibrio parahaemolyticus]EGQ8200591.1 hypothetical protein [Vibrio parahaemolyticus]
MNKYSIIVNVLESVLSVDVGLNEFEEQECLKRMFDSPEKVAALKAELEQLLSDTSIDLIELLDNDSYTAYPADDEQDAKQFIVDCIWKRVINNPVNTSV